ncbi:hypothetical protein BASA50_006756 [Batrachochytrium salamandrivorans]|uniref:Dolichyl-diphosphooligosaccharide-protein glycosyltransferase subunit OST5 n=1 Tax=Batrachochytrium salamandrivorans TaxID=1357716 RepID=A0ABQ8F939_9FUNG|nr:hypothetical protein BASA62_001392 [Batrachochytrium salamandrivorans]KAH6580150.1 hypothetical protein BASA60_002967 [Batrachochytrium salamandrivorans]KAH6590512.1 hypothetical protein BASA61_005271 [Batrachochytrium salamandrivorans]KAH6594285.1 hypothetical protein BASA50_006756 [Batrachochytrium salamandrivorans]KAH9250288.1 hypothetical protein BASA81_011905 [Batrachochytrium salamandrivorans]
MTISDMNLPGMVAFQPLFPQSSFLTIASLFLMMSFLASSMFLIKQVGTNKYTRSLFQEILFGLLGSTSFGFGLVFLFLGSGIYV